SRHRVCHATLYRQFDLENRSSGRPRYPDFSVVTFYDRMTDRKSHSHSARLGREQRFEDELHVGRVNSAPGILDRQMDITALSKCGSYREYAKARRTHGFDGVHDEVHDDLLNLHLVAQDGRQIFAEADVGFDTLLAQVDMD